MPRYHFNVRDGHDLPDEEGTELPDIATARREAVAFAGRMIAESADTFWKGQDWFVTVTDDIGIVLFTLMFAAVMSAGLDG